MATTTFTKRTETLDNFFKDIRKCTKSKISQEQELKYFLQYKNGTESEKKEAKDKLYNSLAWYMVGFAKNYQYKNGGFYRHEDLINEAYIGFEDALNTFKAEKGTRLITHLKQRIWAQITATVDENSRTIDLPINQARLLAKIKKESELFYKKRCYTPSAFELSVILTNEKKEISESDIRECLLASQGINSVDKKFGNDEEDGTLLDIYENSNSPLADSGTQVSDAIIEAERLLNTISEKEKYIIIHSYEYSQLMNTEYKTDDILAKELNYKTPESIRLIRKSAQNRLKQRHENR